MDGPGRGAASGPQQLAAVFLRTVPVPSLNHYIGLSIFVTSAALVSLHYAFADSPELDNLLRDEILKSNMSALPENREWIANLKPMRILYHVLSDSTLSAVFVNAFYATLAIVGRLLVHFSFALSRQERAVARASLLTCVLCDLVFLSVIAGNQANGVLPWMIWFGITAFFAVINQICNQRFKYISPSGGSPGVGMTVACSVVFLSSTVLFGLLLLHSDRLSTSNFLFLIADVSISWLRSGRGVFRCWLAWVDLPSSTARSLSYNTDVAVTVFAELIQLLHFIHLVFFSPVGFNLTSIFFVYHVKIAYSSILATLNRYLKHRMIFRHIQSKYPRLETPSEDLCIVCWERLGEARVLECGHVLHEWCIMWWLEQDASCPTCRRPLPSTGPEGRQEGAGANLQQYAYSTTWHFSGELLGGLLQLPSFTIGLSHNLGGGAAAGAARGNSQLNAHAAQVQEMFPQLPLEVILNDLRTSGSSQATIDNILEGRVAFIGEPIIEETDEETSSSDEEAVVRTGTLGARDELMMTPLVRHDEQGQAGGGGDASNCLLRRKQEMIRRHRRRYIESTQGEDLRMAGIME